MKFPTDHVFFIAHVSLHGSCELSLDVEVDGGGLLEMINNHLQAFRMLPWVIGGMGVLLLVRYSGMVR